MKKKSKVLAIALITVVLLGCILSAGCTSTSTVTTNNSTTNSSSTDIPEVDQNAGDYVKPVTGSMVLPNVTYIGFNKMTIPPNTTEIQGIDIYNPEANAGYYDQTFELFLENGESLYKSGLVSPGKHIQKLTLTHGLNPGTYKAYLHIQPYLIDNPNAELNNGEVEFILEVV